MEQTSQFIIEQITSLNLSYSKAQVSKYHTVHTDLAVEKIPIALQVARANADDAGRNSQNSELSDKIYIQ